MAQIRVLPDNVANQIAAGEVIERPASVIKELVENSLDAEAARIDISFKSGGRSYLRVEDDGRGMSRDDALLSLERHATSKIRQAKDLDALGTMGFRGEALPSIASVSNFTLQTRLRGEEAGTEIAVNGGKILHVKDCGMPEGTRIQASDLFNTVPARRKFLKTVPTEAAHIVQCARLYALANAKVAFSLSDDGRVLFRSPSCDRLQDRIAEIFGKQAASSLLPLEAEEEGMRLSGFIGGPGQSRASRHEMLVFVNRRPVESRTLGYALVESYYGHIPKGRYPIAFLFLEIPPGRIDVNVHPAKKEIRFRNEAQARGFAVRTLLDTLRQATRASVGGREAPPPRRSSQAPTPQARSPLVQPSPSGEGQGVPSPPGGTEKGPGPSERAPQPQSVRPSSTHSPPPTSRAASVSSPEAQPPGESATGESDERRSSAPFERWRFLAWYRSDTALFETPDGLTLLNAASAQQRIWFERLLGAYQSQSVESQSLLLPVPVEFDPISSVIVGDHLEFLESRGLRVEPFGRNFYRIEAVPTWLDEGGAEDYLRQVVSLLRSSELSESRPRQADEILARHAARRAARPKESWELGELNQLLETLFACQNPHVDPEGRPTHIEISKGEIDRRFHRTGQRRPPDYF